ncbi:MAG: class I SAM-dependent methyltransferase [Alphaproteobacteria bacterium]
MAQSDADNGGAANLDPGIVHGFGEQWSKYDQAAMPKEDVQREFDGYFDIFPWELVSKNATGFDMGCGTGRWAKLVAPRVGHLNCIEPSRAVETARKKLADAGITNASFFEAGVGNPPLPEKSQDFGYVLGVLHYVPDPVAGLNACVKLLKPGAPLLVYVYYRFDNRPLWFRAIWKASDMVRRIVSALPFALRNVVTNLIALLAYWPLSRLSLVLEKLGVNVDGIPLSENRHETFYYMKTLSLDRFGSRIEHRFTRKELTKMLIDAGCENIRFSDKVYWAASATRRRDP